MNEKHFNKNSFNQKLIIAGCAGLVSEEGYAAREVVELLEEMKNQLYFALREMEEELE